MVRSSDHLEDFPEASNFRTSPVISSPNNICPSHGRSISSSSSPSLLITFPQQRFFLCPEPFSFRNHSCSVRFFLPLISPLSESGMNYFNHQKGCDIVHPVKGTKTFRESTKLGGMGFNEKKEAVHSEISRVNKLPVNSSYAQHRSRVLNKLLHLMSIQRTASEDEELELLFAGLSL